MAAKRKKKPRASRRTGKPPGRPAADPAKVTLGLQLLAQGDGEAAVRESGVSLPTLYRHKAKLDQAAPAAPPSPAPALAAPSVELPQGGAVAMRSDLLVLVRRILGKRNPGALAELDAGLLEATRGEGELAAWLDRPLERGEAADPAEALARALDAATMHAEKLPPLHPRAATILGAVATLGTKLENVTKGRPKLETPDQVHEKIRSAMDGACDFLLRPTREAAAAFARDRAALASWATQELAPRTAAELGKRIDAMLGGPPS